MVWSSAECWKAGICCACRRKQFLCCRYGWYGSSDLQGSSLVSKQYAALDFTNQEIAEPERLPPLATLPCTEIRSYPGHKFCWSDWHDKFHRSSDMGILANIGSNAEITVDASRNQSCQERPVLLQEVLLTYSVWWCFLDIRWRFHCDKSSADNGNLVISGPDATRNVGNVVR